MFRRFISRDQRALCTIARATRNADSDGEATEDALPTIRGTAAVYFDDNDRAGTQYELWSGAVERIMPGAFAEALRTDEVVALRNHNQDMILGRTSNKKLRLMDQDGGLDYEVDPDQTTVGQDTVRMLERQDITGSSFQFSLRESGAEWEEEQHEDGFTLYVRKITSVRLFDVGPVTFPAYSGTSSGVRSALCLSDCRSTHARSELTSLQAEVAEFVKQNNYRSTASDKLQQLEDSFRMLSVAL